MILYSITKIEIIHINTITRCCTKFSATPTPANTPPQHFHCTACSIEPGASKPAYHCSYQRIPDKASQTKASALLCAPCAMVSAILVSTSISIS